MTPGYYHTPVEMFVINYWVWSVGTVVFHCVILVGEREREREGEEIVIFYRPMSSVSKNCICEMFLWPQWSCG